MGTDGGGINILDPTTGNITVLEHISGDNHSLPTNTILCLHSDSAGNIWAGSKREGVINIREVSMRTYTNVVLGAQQRIKSKYGITTISGTGFRRTLDRYGRRRYQ